MSDSFKPRPDRTLRILVAGGCHVVGFPVGVGDSLTGVLENELRDRGFPVQTLGIPYVKLTHVDKVLVQCRSFQPDVVVLQLGHFELSRTLGTYLRRRFRHGQSTADSTPSSMTNDVRNAGLFYARAMLRMCADWCLRHPLVDFALVRIQLDQFLASMEQGECPSTILLSPLPCADPLFMSYRRRAGHLFEQVAATHRCSFVDLTRAVPSGLQLRFGLSERSYNGSHLGSEGIRMVGKTLAEYLSAAITDLPVKAGAR